MFHCRVRLLAISRRSRPRMGRRANSPRRDGRGSVRAFGPPSVVKGGILPAAVGSTLSGGATAGRSDPRRRRRRCHRQDQASVATCTCRTVESPPPIEVLKPVDGGIGPTAGQGAEGGDSRAQQGSGFSRHMQTLNFTQAARATHPLRGNSAPQAPAGPPAWPTGQKTREFLPPAGPYHPPGAAANRTGSQQKRIRVSLVTGQRTDGAVHKLNRIALLCAILRIEGRAQNHRAASPQPDGDGSQPRASAAPPSRLWIWSSWLAGAQAERASQR